MRDLLRRFELFDGLNPAIIDTIARLSSLVRFPAGRWLLRPGRALNHHLFLVRGRVRAVMPDAEVRGDTPAARHPLHPGHAGLVTLSAVEMLRVGSNELDFLLDAEGLDARCEEEVTEPWQLRFLRSHMMSALPMSCWQGLLRVVEPVEFAAGADVIVEGDAANVDHCYILASGRGIVHRARHRHRQVLRLLGPGDFFGEDALLLGRPRNASITLIEPGTVMRLSRPDFQQFLMRALLSEELDRRLPSGTATGCHSDLRLRRLLISGHDSLRDRLAGLDPCCGYRVEGDNPEAVGLAVFLLRQRGINARRA